jgi:NAD(P)-dependent dehydrogenase (short-subunit alcohol dehydrogenase family)
MNLSGKTVIITGGARGIGLAIANRFLGSEAWVHILDREFPENWPAAENPRLQKFAGDVSSMTDVQQFVAGVIAKGGRIDILINNAGILRDNTIWHMPESDFDDVLKINLKGPWLMCREVTPHMRRQEWGRIVNIASRAWLGNFGQSNYSSSKGGLVSLTRVLALELARYNITVNAVAPGLIETPMTRGLPPETYQKLLQAQPGKKAGTPDDIAAAVAFLASEEAGFITGQVLHVDGGRSIGSTVF